MAQAQRRLFLDRNFTSIGVDDLRNEEKDCKGIELFDLRRINGLQLEERAGDYGRLMGALNASKEWRRLQELRVRTFRSG
jgi:hypothetical protein